MEKLYLVETFRNKNERRNLIALLAPAIASQFGSDIDRIMYSFIQLGFTKVI